MSLMPVTELPFKWIRNRMGCLNKMVDTYYNDIMEDLVSGEIKIPLDMIIRSGRHLGDIIETSIEGSSVILTRPHHATGYRMKNIAERYHGVSAQCNSTCRFWEVIEREIF
jgi:hypothetical protein